MVGVVFCFWMKLLNKSYHIVIWHALLYAENLNSTNLKRVSTNYSLKFPDLLTYVCNNCQSFFTAEAAEHKWGIPLRSHFHVVNLCLCGSICTMPKKPCAIMPWPRKRTVLEHIKEHSHYSKKTGLCWTSVLGRSTDDKV